MRNLGFPETCSPGTFFTPPHQEKLNVAQEFAGENLIRANKALGFS